MNKTIPLYPNISQSQEISSLTCDLLRTDQLVEELEFKISLYSKAHERYLIQLEQLLATLNQEIQTQKDTQ